MKKVTIFTPTYNEAGNIGNLIEAINSLPIHDKYKIDIVVIDDNSPDGTANIVKESQNKYENVHLVNGNKQGYGEACKRGFDYVLTNFETDVILQLDADFSHDPVSIVDILHEMDTNNSEFVIGSRYVKGGKLPENWGMFRIMNSKMGNLLVRAIFPMRHIRDNTSGYRAISSRVVENINFKNFNAKANAFLVEFLFCAYKNGVKIAEVPIHFKDRKYGESKLTFYAIAEFVLSCFKIRFNKHEANNNKIDFNKHEANKIIFK